MKNKVTTLIIAGILTVGGISVAYSASKTNTILNDFNRPTMGTHANNSKSSYNNNSIKKGTQNSGTQSYETDIMQKNGYAHTAKRMQSVNREDMIKAHQSMMGR